MLRYKETAVVFREVPGEITLAVGISGCPPRCQGCHSPHLWEAGGLPLTEDALAALVTDNPGITCVALMGGDGDPSAVAALLMSLRRRFGYGLKTCWYSGRGLEDAQLHVGPMALDYLKVGPFVKEKGPLDRPTTNQHMYAVKREVRHDGTMAFVYEDMTYQFWKDPIEIRDGDI